MKMIVNKGNKYYKAVTKKVKITVKKWVQSHLPIFYFCRIKQHPASFKIKKNKIKKSNI